jgi:hypothetical protein
MAYMKAKFPQFSCQRKNYGYDFVGILNPRGNEYLVKVEYRKGRNPNVFVINPDIIPNRHMYKDRSLCIYKRAEMNWTEDKLVSEYVIPLTCMWLHFYETYLKTKLWLGPEAPHDDTDDKDKFVEISE